MSKVDLPLEAFLERFLSDVKAFSKSGKKADIPNQSVYQVIGNYQQAFIDAESVRRFSKDSRDLTGDEFKVLMCSEEYGAIKKRGSEWIEKHAEEVSQFM